MPDIGFCNARGVRREVREVSSGIQGDVRTSIGLLPSATHLVILASSGPSTQKRRTYAGAQGRMRSTKWAAKFSHLFVASSIPL
eukprot:scaffold216813_cov31-Tisochrysis_lutea.AAC.7